ncbi:hypothetical protein HMI55_000400 [Coelomomyces lativittatus]|nr:hypothetical protein HMI55_000400 [Coelomomyces lativittatus]
MDIFLQHCFYPPSSIKDECAFIRSNCNEWIEGSFNYLDIYFCNLSNPFKHLFILGLILSLIALFLFIGVAASEFFSPNLAAISHSLNLSESLSGVTLLALGNGSPDLFSTFSAMRSSAAGLAVGELVGAAAFVTTMTVGTVAFLSPFRIHPLLFFRDIGFLFSAMVLNVLVLWDDQITLLESFFLMLYYVFYVGVVVYLDFYVTSNLNTEETAPLLMTPEFNEDEIPIIEQDSVIELTNRLLKPTPGGKKKLGVLDTVALYEQMHCEYQPCDDTTSPFSIEIPPDYSPNLKSLLFPCSKITSSRPKLERWFMLLLSPFYAILRISIPVASSSQASASLFGAEIRYLPLDLLQSFWGVIVCCTSILVSLEISWSLQHFSLALIFGVLSVCIHLALLKYKGSMKKDGIFCWFGVAVAIAWISLIANEMIVILRILGFFFNISDSVLGLTLSSVGNSLGGMHFGLFFFFKF